MKDNYTHSHIVSDQSGLNSGHLSASTCSEEENCLFIDICSRHIAWLYQSESFFLQGSQKLPVIPVDLGQSRVILISKHYNQVTLMGVRSTA